MAIQMSATLIDIARRVDKDGKIAQIIEALKETNALLEDMLWVECNEGTSHKTTIRTGLPEVFWRKYNMGVQPSKSTTKQITDHTAMLEGRSNVDAKLVQLNAGQDKGKTYRASEDIAFLEAMNQKVARTLFYGTESDADQFPGLTIRYSDPTAENGKHIFDGGGTGSTNTSIWIVAWGDRSIHGLYPKGSKAGFEHEDLGKREVQDANGGEFTALSSKYEWDPGLTVRDWRYACRIANVDVNNLDTTDLITLLTKAVNKIPNNRTGMRMSIYCREEILTALELQVKNKDNVHLSIEDLENNRQVLKFKGYPMRQVDQLLATEEKVTFPA